MVSHRDLEGARVLERGAHEVARDHGPAVVGNRHRAGAHHLTELGEPLSLLTDRHGADRMHAREPGAHRLTYDEADRRLVVGDGIGVRHGAHRGEPARRGGPGAAGDRLDVLVARLSQVDVYVHEAGGHDVAPHVPHLGIVGSAEPRPDRGDLAILDEDIGGLVEAPARVDHATTAQDERPHHSGPPERLAASASSGRPPASRYNTAIRTATPFVT